MAISETIIEEAAITWFEKLGLAIGHGPHIALDEPTSERDSFGGVALVGRLHEALARLSRPHRLLPERARKLPEICAFLPDFGGGTK